VLSVCNAHCAYCCSLCRLCHSLCCVCALFTGLVFTSGFHCVCTFAQAGRRTPPAKPRPSSAPTAATPAAPGAPAKRTELTDGAVSGVLRGGGHDQHGPGDAHQAPAQALYCAAKALLTKGCTCVPRLAHKCYAHDTIGIVRYKASSCTRFSHGTVPNTLPYLQSYHDNRSDVWLVPDLSTSPVTGAQRKEASHCNVMFCTLPHPFAPCQACSAQTATW